MPTQYQWDKRFLEEARNISRWSKDPWYRHGTIAVNDKRIISTGYNGLPRGSLNEKEILNNREKKRVHIIHSEANAIYNCIAPAKLEGCTFYVAGVNYLNEDGSEEEVALSCCLGCINAMIQVGVTRLVMPASSLKSLYMYKDDAPYFLETALTAFEENGRTYSFI